MIALVDHPLARGDLHLEGRSGQRPGVEERTEPKTRMGSAGAAITMGGERGLLA